MIFLQFFQLAHCRRSPTMLVRWLVRSLVRSIVQSLVGTNPYYTTDSISPAPKSDASDDCWSALPIDNPCNPASVAGPLDLTLFQIGFLQTRCEVCFGFQHRRCVTERSTVSREASFLAARSHRRATGVFGTNYKVALYPSSYDAMVVCLKRIAI
jgi:hypothetical protein